MISEGRFFNKLLRPVTHLALSIYCQMKEFPFNVLVISKDTGRSRLDNIDVPKEQARVFAHIWIAKQNHAEVVPRSKGFAQATATKRAAA